MGSDIKISPSVMSADFTRLGEQVAEATKAGADYIHIDVIDGHFAPLITIGPSVTNAIRKCTNLPLDIHLMTESPEQQINQFASVGANIITFHIEACTYVHYTIQMIRDKNIKVGIAVNPATPIDSIYKFLPEIDMVVVMSVNPGVSGQSFIENTLHKIACVRSEINKLGLNVDLEVDGGINIKTAPPVVNAGGTVLVAGSAIFKSGETINDTIRKLRETCL
jgi:ribulose-phosphate 3-epimerase